MTKHVPLGQYPDSKVHGANMGPTWVLWARDGTHVEPMTFAIRVVVAPYVDNNRSKMPEPQIDGEFNELMPEYDYQRCADEIFKRTSLKENIFILIQRFNYR